MGEHLRASWLTRVAPRVREEEEELERARLGIFTTLTT